MLQYVKMNYSSDPIYTKELWKCSGCSSIDTESHLLWCPSYASLRLNLDLSNNKDLAKYLQEILKIRFNLCDQKKMG